MRSQHYWRSLIVLVNALVILVSFIGCYWYTHRQGVEQRERAQSAFSITVNSMGKVAYSFMSSQQEICNNWAKFLNEKQQTVEEAKEFLSLVKSNEDIMAHLVSAETLRGYSTMADKSGQNDVDYTRLSSIFSAAESGDSGAISITTMYTNPINALNCVSFVRTVTLIAEDGLPAPYYLLRVVPISMVKEAWVFPTEYEKAELSVIKADGDYVYRSDTMRNQNLWEYLRIYNHLDYAESDALAQRLLATGELYAGLDVNGREAYYVCHAAEASDWYFVGYLPVNSLHDTSIDFTMVWMVGMSFLFLFVLDGAWMLNVNKKLAQSAEETRQANLAKTNFLSSMSHDIRTPMNAIIGMTTIATKHINEPEQIEDCLKKITLASNHLLTLVNDILDISKVESGKMMLNPVAFSASEMLSNLSNIMRPNVRAKRLEMDIHVRGFAHEELFADELRLNQIYINLLSNAVKYTPEGGKIVMDMTQVPVTGDDQHVELIFRVEDNGIGMSAEFQKKMYNTFSRAVDTRVDKIQGSGLGLAITKQMVDLMGGSIECQSAEGKGTTFTVRLRVALAEKMSEEVALPPMRVLVVDDDEIFLETASDIIQSLNLQVETAPDGATAVEMVRSAQNTPRAYSVVIIDYKMPGMDGVETACRIREQMGKDAPIILISSYDCADIEETVREAGANDFISKPLFRSTLQRKISEVLHLIQKEEKSAEEETKEFAGKTFLVAEDNDLNWEIISELLEMYGINADRAIDGAICVDMLERARPGRYDAILMDVQMPTMNGREASMAIRGLADARINAIPIIAMTADAFAEDIRACMEAGMNGHVAKPIDLDKLIEELRRVGI